MNLPMMVQTANGAAVGLPVMPIGYGMPQPYDAAKTYSMRDVVQYGGSTYAVMRDGVTGVPPANDGENYRYLSMQGQPGVDNAQWHAGTAVSGNGVGIEASVQGSQAGDMYLNSHTSDLYHATAPDTWDWVLRMADLVTVNAVFAAGVTTDEPGVSVQQVLDDHDAAIADLDGRVDDVGDVAAGLGTRLGGQEAAVLALKEQVENANQAGQEQLSALGVRLDTTAQALSARPLSKTLAAVLPVADWAGAGPYTQTVAITDLATDALVQAGPAPGSLTDFAQAPAYATAQEAGSLTFTAQEAPETDLTINIAYEVYEQFGGVGP